jgi:outer membrane protein W
MRHDQWSLTPLNILEVLMKRLMSFGAVGLLLFAGTGASAQNRISGFAAFGASQTSGDLKDADSTKSGFMVQGGFEYKLTAPLWLRFDASMSWNDRVGALDDDAYIWTFAMRGEYWLPMTMSKLRPYVTAGVGAMLYKRNPLQSGSSDSDAFSIKSRVLTSAGAGIDYQIGGSSLFLEGRYDMGADNRAMIPLMLGARWGAR